MNRFFSKIAGAVIAIALGLSLIAPASATINPTIATSYLGPGAPGQGRIVAGSITLGTADTYTAGGFTVSPSQLGCSVAITAFEYNAPAASFETISTITAGVATAKFIATMNGVSNMTAAATTKTVTIPTGFNATNDVLSANTAIYVQLNDAATGGGGSGTWAVTDAVASVKFVSASTFTLTVIAAAPTSGGNFVWQVPGLNMEMAAATSIAGLIIPFTATCV